MLRRYNIKPRKKLGQNFLINRKPLLEMLKAAHLSPKDNVLEIGPGLGVLTVELAQRAAKVVAVEKDGQFLPVLEDITRDFKNVCILREDVLKLDLETVSESNFCGKFKVIANLPYYITSPIIMKIIQNRNFITSAVLMVQKEVAKRLSTGPGGKDYGILSIAVQLYADVKLICTVSSKDFIPQPKVDSAVIKLDLREKPRVFIEDEKFFFQVIEAAFGERRKTLRNALKRRLAAVGIDEDAVKKALDEAGIDSKRRAETLSIDEFANLAQKLKEKMK